MDSLSMGRASLHRLQRRIMTLELAARAQLRLVHLPIAMFVLELEMCTVVVSGNLLVSTTRKSVCSYVEMVTTMVWQQGHRRIGYSRLRLAVVWRLETYGHQQQHCWH